MLGVTKTMICPACALRNTSAVLRCVHCGADLAGSPERRKTIASPPYDEFQDHLLKGRVLQKIIRYYCTFAVPFALLFAALVFARAPAGSSSKGDSPTLLVWIVSSCVLLADFSPRHTAYARVLINGLTNQSLV